MKTLYLRNVPEGVSDRLARLAAREGMSVSAFAVRELETLSRRADNEALLTALPSVHVTGDDVVAGLARARDER